MWSKRCRGNGSKGKQHRAAPQAHTWEVNALTHSWLSFFLSLYVHAQAKEKGLFLLEGMWTRFFPVVEMARHLITTGVIGKSPLSLAVKCWEGERREAMMTYKDYSCPECLFIDEEISGIQPKILFLNEPYLSLPLLVSHSLHPRLSYVSSLLHPHISPLFRMCFPCYCTGKVVALHADFGFNSSDSEKYPESPFFQRQLGGGGLLFVGKFKSSFACLSLSIGA